MTIASLGQTTRLLAGRRDLMDPDIVRAARARKGTPFLSTDQAAYYLGLSTRKLQQMRKEGSGPAFRRHSRYIRYHIDDLDNWSRGFICGEQGRGVDSTTPRA